MRTIPLDQWTPAIADSGICEIDGEQVRIKAARIDAGAGVVFLYEAGDEFPAIETPPAPPKWRSLYARFLTSGVFPVVRAAIGSGTDNALGAAYTDFTAALQNGESLEEMEPGVGLGAFQVALNVLADLVPLTDPLKLELRALLDSNGFGAIASPLPPPPPEPEPDPDPEPEPGP